MLHRTRDLLIKQRTGLINHIRGLLGEYRVVIPVGAVRLSSEASKALRDTEPVKNTIDRLNGLFRHLDHHL